MRNENVIFDLFDKITEEDPKAPAIIEDDRIVSRAALRDAALAIAAEFPAGAKRIGVVMDHGALMIASIFAALGFGAAYVPAEPDFPKDRIRFMMLDAGVDFIVTQPSYERFFSGFRTITPRLDFEDEINGQKTGGGDSVSRPETGRRDTGRRDTRPEDLAYILYTSGSTGKPKGVAVENRNVCHYARAFQNEFHPGPGDITLQYSVCGFDIFVEEVFASLLAGAAIAIPYKSDKEDITTLMAFADRQKVTIISGFPYLLMELNCLPLIPVSVRLLISGGDVLRADYVTDLLDQAEIYNTYGPSEATVCATYFHCNGTKPLADGSYPVGKAVLGSEIQIMDENLEPATFGEIGEICILGGGVSRGYIGDRKTENTAFTRLPDGRRIYRSGDLGYFLPDGNVAFLRRKDRQIMILGKRVEPDEVESALRDCPGVRQGVVRALKDSRDHSYMAAYYVLESEKITPERIRAFMEKRLTDYMIPDFFVKLDSMPLTPSGKVDYKALPVVRKERKPRGN